LSFGGLGLALHTVPDLAGVSFVCTAGGAVGSNGPAGCRVLTHDEMTRNGVRYEDLLGACDAVMTKPGYGIVADCIANATRIVYTARGRFAEYEVLVAAIEAHLPNAFIGNPDLHAGRWHAALEAVLAQPGREPGMRIDGAQQVAAALADVAL